MFRQAFQIVENFINARNASGAVALISYAHQTTGPKAMGALSFFPQNEVAKPDSIFDLASLSKVVGTTTLTLRLIEDGFIDLNDTLGKLVPDCPGDKKSITILQLLAHTSGLPAVYPLWQDARFHDKTTSLTAVLSVPLNNSIGVAVEYSCIGFILLALILERLTGTTIDILFQEIVAKPLKLQDTGYAVPATKLERVAYTEWDPESKRFLRGVVHDENARSIGGVSGNAGLFSTAHDLGVFCRMFLTDGAVNNRQVLKPTTVNLLKNNYTSDPAQPRTLGWLLPSPRGCSGSELISAHSIGHTGFTGTSIWIDFQRNAYGVLLTNRVHPSRNNTAIIQMRPKFYRAIWQAVDAFNPY